MIVSSIYSLGPLQLDWRRYVTERHTDSLGGVYEREYLSGVIDYQAVANARALVISEELADAEFRAVISG